MYKYILNPGVKAGWATHVLIILNVIQANSRCAFLDVLGLSDPSVFTFFFTFAMAPKKYVKLFFSKRDVLCVCVGVSVQKKGKVKCTSTTCRWTHSKQSGLVQCELLQKCVCVGCVGHLFVFCPSSIEKKHLWIAMWCFRPLKFFIFPNLWPPNSIGDMSNKKKSWSYLDLLTRNDACLEKVTQVHILPTWWWKIMMIYLGRIRKKVNKQTNPKLHSTTRFQPWSWCEPSASLQWFGWNIPLM